MIALPRKPAPAPTRLVTSDDDAASCELITRRHARTFSLASRFLPSEKRRAAFAVYAFCRVADDIVDSGAHDVSAARQLLDRHRRMLDEAMLGAPRGPIFREVMWASERFGIPVEYFHELVDGVGRDLAPPRYETWTELSAYCEGVAASVGALCAHVFEVQPATAMERAVRYARTLGVAMQLTNILRDVGEDRTRGRCYLPAEDLGAFDLTIDEVMQSMSLAHDPRWHGFARHEVARARALYAAARPGIALLGADAQACAFACADGYAGILGAIERNGYDVFTRRARVGLRDRAALIWRLVRGGTEPMPADHDEPHIRWREHVVTRPEEMGSCA